MTDVDALLSEFVEADRVGVPDPSEYLARASGADRAELEALIDAYLARAPRRPFDAAAFAASPARRVVDSLEVSLRGSAGTWPAVLPRLRDRARLRRAEVVARLSAALGASGQEAKVAAYYHAMEQGTLPAAGVSDRVLEALGRIVGESAAALRAAGAALAGPPAPPAAAGAFTRVAAPDPAYAPAPRDEAPPTPSSPDDIDRLFTGGA